MQERQGLGCCKRLKCSISAKKSKKFMTKTLYYKLPNDKEKVAELVIPSTEGI